MHITKTIPAACALLYLLSAAPITAAQAKKPEAKKPVQTNAQPTPVSEKDLAYCKPFLDKDGGYKDKKGGYYNPKAGTYTDQHGGIVDNWGGYTYADGSYKSRSGNYFDAKLNVVKLTSGESVPVPPGTTSAQIIQVMRDDVAANDGYDKNLTLSSMIQSIKNEHPPAHH